MHRQAKHPLRTLPFHLSMQTLLWGSSNAALLQQKAALQNWNAKWPSFAANWPTMPDSPQLQQAVNHELARRSANLLSGIQRYLSHPYRRRESRAHTLWQRGNTRLLDFGVQGEEKARVLFVPSLINRYYILDLRDGRSMVEYLRGQGIRPLVVDWGDPHAEEQGFDSAAYLRERLLPAFEASRGTTPMLLAGYCMGGLLALALAQQVQRQLHGLALIATPWDFHAREFPHVALTQAHSQRLEEILQRHPTLPGETIQTLFYATNPWLFARKFASFARLDPASEEAEDFVAIESWVNDNVDMAAPMARECLIDWVQENRPARGIWQPAGQAVDPQHLELPVFAACPAHDTIVPPDCAGALLPLLQKPTVIRPVSGHVGMVAGAHAEAELWHPFCAWAHAQAAA
jgi:polyhydroxyalkanoate synthase subunit PhaC